tara:strand:- start:1961 stop:3001 length:1041 start_codon:yes stop_codon:yes gene_type:complete
MTIFFNTFFKILAFLLSITVFLSIFIGFLSFFNANKALNEFEKISGDEKSNNIIAIVELNGPIINHSVNLSYIPNLQIIDPNRFKNQLETIKTIRPKVIIVSINSPGGTVSASHEIYEILNKFKNDQNISVYFHTTESLASGAYWFALSADKIYASYGSLIGSIGVKGPDWIYYDNPISMSSGILGSSIETKNGIKIYSQNAGESKDLLNPFRKPTKTEIEKLQLIINSVYEDFVHTVSKQRKIEVAILKEDIGAFIYNSEIAKENYLIDDILSLESLVEKIVRENQFTNYKVYKNSNYNFSILDQFLLKVSNILRTSEKTLSNNHFCNKFKNNISTISSGYLKNC